MVDGFVVYNQDRGYLLFWNVSDTVLSSNDKFIILRAVSESSSFNSIGEVSVDYNHYTDIMPNVSWMERPLYKIQLKRGTEIIDESEILVIDDPYKDNDIRYSMIQNAMGIGLTKSFGNKVFVLQIKTWGAKCFCQDNPRGLTNSSTCSTCMGTGYIGGYYAPILTRAERQPIAKRLTNQMFNLEPGDTVYKFMNYPILKVSDVIVNSRNERLEIVNIRPNYVMDKLTSQLCQVRRVAGQNTLVYKIKVPLEELQVDTYVRWRPL